MSEITVPIQITEPAFIACATEEIRLITRVRRWMRFRRSVLSLVGDVDFLLRAERATGSLTLHYSQGTVALCEFTEKAKIEHVS